MLDIQTRCGDIASEFPNAAIDAERTFKCNINSVKPIQGMLFTYFLEAT